MPPMPPNVQQTPDGTSYDVPRGDQAGAAPCTKIEILPVGGGAPAGPEVPSGPAGFVVRCFTAESGQPTTSNAQNPEDLMRIVGEALGLAPPAPEPVDDTMTESSSFAG